MSKYDPIHRREYIREYARKKYNATKNYKEDLDDSKMTDEQLIAYAREHIKKHNENKMKRRKEMVNCECGLTMHESRLERHRRTKFHQNVMKMISEKSATKD